MCEQLAGQSGRMSVQILRDKDCVCVFTGPFRSRR